MTDKEVGTEYRHHFPKAMKKRRRRDGLGYLGLGVGYTHVCDYLRARKE